MFVKKTKVLQCQNPKKNWHRFFYNVKEIYIARDERSNEILNLTFKILIYTIIMRCNTDTQNVCTLTFINISTQTMLL